VAIVLKTEKRKQNSLKNNKNGFLLNLPESHKGVGDDLGPGGQGYCAKENSGRGQKRRGQEA